MDIAAVAQNQGTAEVAGKKLAEDFDTFLLLLTSQLQNQDPLEPLDSNEFTQQLVQFTGVEQSITTNQNLETLISLMSSQSESSLFDYIGKDVIAYTDIASFDGTNPTEWVYELHSDPAETKLTVKNASGTIIRELDGSLNAGRNTIKWDGLDNSGNPAPIGPYRLEVEAKSAQGADIAHDIFIEGNVESVERGSDGSFLSLNGSLVLPSQIVSIGPKQETTSDAPVENKDQQSESA